jgi:hypothetical protein
MRALTAIISSGSLGISLWALIDYIYYQEPISFQYGEGRLKAILTDLKKMNIKSYRKNNFYFSDIPKRTAIILPMDSSTAMPWLPFQINHPENFSRMDLEKFYKIHKATANRWLNEWQKLKILTKSNNSFQWA